MTENSDIPYAHNNILFVDDEPDVLKALQRALRTEPYHCLLADNARQAMNLLHEHRVQVIISDMRMPGISGAELLAHVEKHFPHTVRLVLSAWSDSDSILQAVNDGHIYRYIVKPWDVREMKITIRQALEVYAMQAERRRLLRQLEAHNKNLEQTVARRSAQLLAMSKQAEIGKYASQIVHNLNNPLHALAGALDLAGLIASQDGKAVPEKLVKALDLARRSAGDLQHIVSGILQHARDERLFQIEKVDVNQVIEQQLAFFNLDPIFRKEVEKKIDLATGLPALMGSNTQIKQIVNNLVANAVDAMEKAPQRRLSVKTAVVNGSVLIEISDTGEGITAADLPHLFSPEFSTKPVGKGTGLGLASVKTMVEAYAGDIQVRSEPGKGTTFTVRLPLKFRS